MITVQVYEDNERDIWDAHAPHPLQAYAWGAFRQITGVSVVRFGMFDSDNTLGAIFQMTVHKIPMTTYSVGYIPRSTLPVDEVLEYIDTYARAHNIIYVKWEPEVYVEQNVIISQKLQVSPHPIFFTWTRILDISQSVEQLHNELEKKTRYNIGLAERKGVTVKEVFGQEAINIFITLFFQTTQRKGFGGHTQDYHLHLWNTLSQAGIAHMFVGYVGEEPVAVYEMFYWHGIAYSPYSASTASHRELKVKNYVLWKTILAAKTLGAQSFDMWGTLGPQVDGKKDWVGFSEFKRGYGGQEIAYIGSYDQIIYPFLYYILSFVQSTRSFVRGFSRKS